MSQLEDADVAELDEGELPENKVLDHLGLVAGMFEELEIGDRIDEHIAQDFEEREVSVGQAVNAMVPGGLWVCPAAALPDPRVFRGVNAKLVETSREEILPFDVIHDPGLPFSVLA